MKRESFLRSLPYLHPVTSKSWPPKPPASRINAQLQQDSKQELSLTNEMSSPPPSKKRRVGNDSRHDKDPHPAPLESSTTIPSNGVTMKQKPSTCMTSETILLFPNDPNDKAYVSIEPCILQNEHAQDVNEHDNKEVEQYAHNNWLTVGPAFFINNQNDSSTNQIKEKDSESTHQTIQNDPALCSFEAAIVIHTLENQPTTATTSSSDSNSPFIKSKPFATPTKSNVNASTTTPNSTSTMSYSQSPNNPNHLKSNQKPPILRRNPWNSSNCSMSLYFRFEQQHIFLVQQDHVLNLIKNSIDSSSHNGNKSITGKNVIPNLILQFEACLFRIFPLSIPSMTFHPTTTSNNSNSNDEKSNHEKTNFQMIEDASTIMECFLRQDWSIIHSIATEQQKQKAYREEQQITSREGSSDIEPGQMDVGMIRALQEEECQEGNKKDVPPDNDVTKGGGDTDTPVKHDNNNNSDEIKSDGQERNETTSKDLKDSQQKDDDVMSLDRAQPSNKTKLHKMQKKVKAKTQLSGYKRSWKAIESIFQFYCDPDRASLLSISKCSKSDEDNLNKLLTTAVDGVSIYYNKPITNNSPSPQQQDSEHFTNKLEVIQEKINESISQLFPAPSLTKNGRKKKHLQNILHRNNIASASSPQKKTELNTTPMSASPLGPLATQSPTPTNRVVVDTDEEASINLETLVQQYERALASKHRLALLPKR